MSPAARKSRIAGSWFAALMALVLACGLDAHAAEAGAPSGSPPPNITMPQVNPAGLVGMFYVELGFGNGENAVAYLVPELQTGRYTAQAITRFYGHLLEPLQHNVLGPDGAGGVLVEYHYRSAERTCDGKARVTTVSLPGGIVLIASITELNGC